MSQAKYPAYALLLLFLLAIITFVLNSLLPKQKISKASRLAAVIPIKIIDTVITNIEGRALYEINCAACHSFGKADGYPITNIEIREPWTDRRNLIRWIKNPEATMNEFEYTRQLIEQFNGRVMPSFPQLSDSEIVNILDYVKELHTKRNY